MAVTHPVVPIQDTEFPLAREVTFQHLLDTYTSETNKVFSVWSVFRAEDLDFRTTPKSGAVAEIIRHQLLSEGRFFGEFLGTPEAQAAEVLPQDRSPEAFALRLLELARPRLEFLAAQPLSWWHEHVPFFDVKRERVRMFWPRILHTSHHRTQLTVCERLLDRPVLPTDGPAADVTWAIADPTLTVEAAARG